MLSKKTLESKAESKIVIIGIGNEYRSDDGLGIIIADKLSNINLNGIRILKQNGEPALLMDSWKDTDKVIVIDAISSGASPGTVNRFDAVEKPLPSQLFHYSTHSFSLADVIELARGLNRLPPSLIIYGIEGKNFTHGFKLSPEVEKAVGKIVELIIKVVRG